MLSFVKFFIKKLLTIKLLYDMVVMWLVNRRLTVREVITMFKEEIYVKIEKMIKKNQYYTKVDLKRAYEKAMYIYNNIHTYNINGWFFKPMLLKNGNLKLNNNVLQWDLPSIITCKQACKFCYALKSEKIYPQTRCMRLRNLFLIEFALNDVNFYNELLQKLKRECIWYYSRKGCNVLRLHSSGDIYSSRYLNFIFKWVENINDIYSIYTYTKQLDNNIIDDINSTYSNLNIVKSFISIDNKKYINYGSTEYIKDISQKLDNKGITYHVCDYGSTNAHTCMGNCKACLHCDTVLFNQH